MNSARRQILEMHTEAKAPPVPMIENVYLVQTREHHMTMRMRRLHVGEPRRRGDLLLCENNQLIPLALPWWRRCGVVTATHADHFRVIP